MLVLVTAGSLSSSGLAIADDDDDFGGDEASESFSSDDQPEDSGEAASEETPERPRRKRRKHRKYRRDDDADQTRAEASATVDVDVRMSLRSGAPPASDQVTLPAGTSQIDVAVAANLTEGQTFAPLSIAPDVWYGATDALTLGIIYSSHAATGFMGGAGEALCVTGKAKGCASVMPNAGLDLRYGLASGSFAVAAEGAVLLRAFDPMTFAAKLGAVMRLRTEKLIVEVSPNIAVGINRREPAMEGSASGNADVANLPVTFLVPFGSTFAVSAQTGVIVPFKGAGKNYAIPASVGAHVSPTAGVLLNATLSIPAATGGTVTSTGFDNRTLTIGGSYAF
ncbi:MAG: hypothetical protein AB7P03_08310 [Kofleriaceae bacterium]